MTVTQIKTIDTYSQAAETDRTVLLTYQQVFCHENTFFIKKTVKKNLKVSAKLNTTG